MFCANCFISFQVVRNIEFLSEPNCVICPVLSTLILISRDRIIGRDCLIFKEISSSGFTQYITSNPWTSGSLFTDSFQFEWCMFVDITEKQFFPFSPHVIWVQIQIDFGPWHLVEITQKLITVKVLKLPCLYRARAITVVVGLTCQENKRIG